MTEAEIREFGDKTEMGSEDGRKIVMALPNGQRQNRLDDEY